jgi:predicted O-methyltransferase YrrM
VRTESARETYLDQTFGATDADLERVRAGTEDDPRAGMAIGPHEARVLQFLIRLGGVRTVVEIGTFHGYSALAMASALPEGGRVITIERDEACFRRARANFAESEHRDRVDARHGSALDVLGTLTEVFDLVFIDANKREYPRYLDWAERHVRRGGLIVGDNTFLWGAVYGEPDRATNAQAAAMREFNLRLADPKRYSSTLVPTVEGLTVAQKLF